MAMDLDRIDQIIDAYPDTKGPLIQVLLDVQAEYDWLPKEALVQVSKRLQIPLSKVYRVATFYNAFNLKPRGSHVVHTCVGTSCHVRGAPEILERVEQVLGVKNGETTPDGEFTLVGVNCLGCCAFGPVVVVDGEYWGRLPATEVDEIFAGYR